MRDMTRKSGVSFRCVDNLVAILTRSYRTVPECDILARPLGTCPSPGYLPFVLHYVSRRRLKGYILEICNRCFAPASTLNYTGSSRCSQHAHNHMKRARNTTTSYQYRHVYQCRHVNTDQAPGTTAGARGSRERTPTRAFGLTCNYWVKCHAMPTRRY